jgi:transcription initiation factor TFIIE subunit beta
MTAAAPVNGHVNGRVNGQVNGQLNGKPRPNGVLPPPPNPASSTLVLKKTEKRKQQQMEVQDVTVVGVKVVRDKLKPLPLPHKSKQTSLDGPKPKQEPQPKQRPLELPKIKQEVVDDIKPEPPVKQEQKPSLKSIPSVATMLERPRLTGQSTIANLRHAHDYLKERRKPLPFKDIASYLSLQHAPTEVQVGFRALLRADPKVSFGNGLFSYKPTLPFADSEGMRAYMRVQPFAGGVRVDDVKDGWPACADELDRMTRDHEALLLRDRRGLARAAHADEPELWPPAPEDDDGRADVESELESRTDAASTPNAGGATSSAPAPITTVAWKEVKLPRTPEDMRAKLQYAGLRTTTAAKEKNRGPAKKVAKKKVNKRGGRTTNIHIQHLLKDYSKR